VKHERWPLAELFRKEFVMLARKIILAAVLAAAAAVPAVGEAAPNSSPPCILSEHKILSVLPYKVDEHIGKNVIQRVRGAQVYLQAEPGLTPEWLQLTFERHFVAMKGSAMPDCAFGVEKVRVDVSSIGPGFWVRLVAPDAKSGEEVLRRAELLVK
jgi:hypothetical protein